MLISPKYDETKLFLPYQVNWIEDTKTQVLFWEKTRRGGMTYAEAFADVKDVLEGNEDDIWFTSKSDSAAEEYIIYCAKWAELFKQFYEQVDEKILDDNGKSILKRTIRFKINGVKRRITALSSSPDEMRSKGGKVVIDEYAFHKDDTALWKSAYATAKIWGHRIRVISTHNGKGTEFYRWIEKIKAQKVKFGLHTTTIEQALDQGLLDRIRNQQTTADDRKEFLQELRDESGSEENYLEEFMCVAVDESTAFITYNLIKANESANTLLNSLDEVTGDLYIGVDIGRKKDLTVIWINEKLGDKFFTRKVIVLSNMAFSEQKTILFPFIEHSNVRRVCIDSTGLGMNLAEDAQIRFGTYRIEMVTFTAKAKEEMATHSRNMLDDRLFTIPESPEIREDFHSMKKIVTGTGNIRFDSERALTDGHADRFWAASLALNAGRNYSTEPPIVISRGRRKMSAELEKY